MEEIEIDERHIIQVVEGDQIAPCSIYLFEVGHCIIDVVELIAESTHHLYGSPHHATARLIGVLHNHIPGNLSLMVHPPITLPIDQNEYYDASIIIYDILTGIVTTYFGDLSEKYPEPVEVGRPYPAQRRLTTRK